jgi:hypothetical protein
VDLELVWLSDRRGGLYQNYAKPIIDKGALIDLSGQSRETMAIKTVHLKCSVASDSLAVLDAAMRRLAFSV